MKNFKGTKKLLAMMVAGTILTTTLVGCKSELAPKEEYDIVKQQQVSGKSALETGLVQELAIPGENFKLITEYTCDDESKRAWRITSDKFLYLKLHTKDLPDDTEVYIDNIHIDTSIKARNASMDGIIQDTMDDRIHNSKMLGFIIGNNTYYYGVDAIEGCNDTFIQGTFQGMNGYSSGDIEEKRYTEGNYLEAQVFANKFQIVYDLLVKGPKDKDYRNVSVNTDFLVPITSNVVEYDDGTTVTYENGKALTKKK